MKKLFVFIAVLMFNQGHAWEPYDRVLAIVNDTPVIESEVDGRYAYFLKMGKLPRPGDYGKSRILDTFIEKALVNQVAERETIIVSDIKVTDQLKRYMEPFYTGKVKPEELESVINKVSDRIVKHRQKDAILAADERHEKLMKDFIAFLEAQNNIPFDEYFEELRTQILRELVMSIAIGVSPPSKEEALAWYYQNLAKLGFEVNVQHILIRPRGASLTAERDANTRIGDLLSRANRGESFDALAAQFSEERVSGAKGGHLGWVMLQELDPYFANVVYQMNRIGGISQVFKSAQGYHIVKLLGKRNVTFEKVENLIMMKLYSEKMMDQFGKWVEQQKKASEIKIYMANYVKE